MDTWIENYYALLESGIDKIPRSDFRFYNIGRLPLMALKTKEFSANCKECRKNLTELEEMAANLPEIMNDRARRTLFGESKSAIESHLSKMHRVRPAHYFYALYTLYGAVGGSMLGFIISLLTGNTINLNLVLIFFAAGLITGQVFGKRADRRRYRNKMQY